WLRTNASTRVATVGDDDKGGAVATDPAGTGGGGSILPSIRRAKLKGGTKLIIVGDNFTLTSQILLNGQSLPQSEINFDASSNRLVFKGFLNLGPPGTNVLYVISSAGSSSAFVF